MIRENRGKLILSSLLTLLPIAVGLVLWKLLPETLATHWGVDGRADGFGSLPYAVFVPPLLILATHWLCILVVAGDPKNRGRNRKPFAMLLWIMPVVSNLSAAVMYGLALGADHSAKDILSIFIGLLFLIIGNYLPKCRQNHTIGIKVPWTFASEENWNATHRFGGRVWMVGGLLIMLTVFLPEALGTRILFVSILVLAVVPIAYSWLYYRRQKARGDAMDPLPAAGKTGKLGLAALLALLLFVGAMLFTGDIHVTFGQDSFTIEASFYDDLTVAYDRIDSLEYREGDVDGDRLWGVGSFRLLLGSFRNEEFGSYTRYTYYRPQACVILSCDGKTLVLSGKDPEETQSIYQTLSHRIH